MRSTTALLVIGSQLLMAVLFLSSRPQHARAADPRASGLYWDEAAASFVRQRVAGSYVDALDEEGQKDAFFRALEAYVHLDPYCDFIPPSEYKAWQESTAGEYGGLGIRIRPEPEGLRIRGVLPGGPASKAGLVPGDLVLSADGRSLANLDLKSDTALKTLKGAPGVPVRLVVRSASPSAPSAPGTPAAAGAPREVTAVRDVVRPPGVFVRRVGPKQSVGVIHLVEFAETTSGEFDGALNAFLAEGVDGLVLDLRDNSGGVLAAAVHVVDRFLSRGVIVRMEGRAPGATKTFHAQEQHDGPSADVPDTLPLVVLVNGRSASASEVVSGALQDHRRALLVGERTYGKFLVQQITELPRGDCAVQLVTSRYYTPSGRSYQRHLAGGGLAPPPGASVPDADDVDEAAGLLPDVVQPLTKEQRERLARHWDNEEDKRWGSEPSHPEVAGNDVDPQLQRALEVLDGELALRKIRTGAARSR